MATVFPGMDPYLEHPVRWEGLHARLIVEIANQLQPRLDPRYVASIEERVFIEGPQRRIPDVWIQKTTNEPTQPSAATELVSDTAVILEVEELEIHQKRVEILDAYNEMKLVALVELLSPTNKNAGPGRESYLQKQRETLDGNCHLIEIDLLRNGAHTLSVPDWRVEELRPYDYLTCVSRWPRRHRYELYARGLRQQLPTIQVPLAEPDVDVPLDLQAALTAVYEQGRYARRVRYDEPCVPSLTEDDQRWADGLVGRVC